MPNPKRHYADPGEYEQKLRRVMERFGSVTGLNWNYDRHGAWVEFRRGGQYYRLEQTVQKSQASKADVRLHFGSDCFCQIVLALEDLARLKERGIYDLQVWIAGLRALPAGDDVPACLLALGLDQVPKNLDDLEAGYREAAKRAHPDGGGTPQQWKALQKAHAEARTWWSVRGGS